AATTVSEGPPGWSSRSGASSAAGRGAAARGRYPLPRRLPSRSPPPDPRPRERSEPPTQPSLAMSYRSSNRRSIYSRARSTPYLILRSVEREYWIALTMAAGIGPPRFQRLLEVCGDAASPWNASQFHL